MKNLRTITLVCLLVGVIVLTQGFETYAKKMVGKESMASPDGKNILRVEKDVQGEKVVFEEYEKNGRLNRKSESNGTLLEAKWAKDSSAYIVNLEVSGDGVVEVCRRQTDQVCKVNTYIKDKLYTWLEKQHKMKLGEETKLSLLFESWCDDNTSIFLKYEVKDKKEVLYSGYLIWKYDSEALKTIYEI